MKLNPKEGALLAAVVLTWALTPLILFYGLPQYASQTGPVMLIGMLVAAAIITRLLFRVGRRIDGECRARLATDGINPIPLSPDLLPTWIPREHRDRPAVRFTGFPNSEGLRTGYYRKYQGLRLSLYAYSNHRDKLLFTVARFESDSWSWPDISCAVGSRFWSRIYPIDGWDRIQFEADPAFSKSCWLQASRPDRVTPLFHAEVRRLVLEHREFRISASGPVLMLYCSGDRLVPDAAEAFIAQAGAFAAELARHLHER
jgi:hypothetical protein